MDPDELLKRLREAVTALTKIATSPNRGDGGWAARVAKRVLNNEDLEDCRHQTICVEEYTAGPRHIIVFCHQTVNHAGCHDGEHQRRP